MFTGLIEEVGAIRYASPASLTITCTEIQKELAVGDSVAVNGVCLTIITFSSNLIKAEVMPVTLQKTNLGRLRSGSRVNLERAMKPSQRLGGHLVSGHVDATVTLKEKRGEGDALLLSFSLPPSLRPYIILRGSVALDGISLTVAGVSSGEFTVSLVGHTRTHTGLSEKRMGDEVNLECDQIGKYVHHQQNGDGDKNSGKSDISRELLLREGFL